MSATTVTAMPRRAGVSPLEAGAVTLLLIGVAALLPGWSGILLVCFIALVGISRVYPAAAVAFTGATIPLDQSLIIDLPGPSVSVPHLGVWALIVAVGPRLIYRRDVLCDRMMALWLLVIVALVASIGASTVDLDRWLTAISRWMLPAGVYLLLRSLRLDARHLEPVLGGIAVGVLISTAIAVWQVATVGGPESFIAGGLMRAYGPFEHPNQLAAWLALTVPLLAAVPLIGGLPRRRSMRWLVIIAVGAGAVALLLTQSRSGQFAFAAAMLVLFAFASRRARSLAAGIVGGLLLLAVTAGSIAGLPGSDRFADIAVRPGDRVQVTPATWAQEERKAHWGAAWSMLEASPLTGVGAGGFEANFREHTTEWRFRIPRGHAHNGYLHMGAESGWPGLLAYTAFVLGALALLVRRAVVAAPGTSRAVAAGALAVMVAFAAISVFEHVEFGAFLSMVALILALGLSTRRDRQQGMTP